MVEGCLLPDGQSVGTEVTSVVTSVPTVSLARFSPASEGDQRADAPNLRIELPAVESHVLKTVCLRDQEVV
jgi:hypothetical protein